MKHLRVKSKGKIDVGDLPEEEVLLIAAFVEFLKQRKQQSESTKTGLPGMQSNGSPARSNLHEDSFAVWPLGVRGTLS